MITQLVSSLLARHSHGDVFGCVWLGSNIRSGQRSFYFHTCLRQRIFSVLQGHGRVLYWSHFHRRACWWRHVIVRQVPGVRHVHLGAVWGRRRRVLIGHYGCHEFEGLQFYKSKCGFSDGLTVHVLKDGVSSFAECARNESAA
jgi:hypothetical protein